MSLTISSLKLMHNIYIISIQFVSSHNSFKRTMVKPLLPNEKQEMRDVKEAFVRKVEKINGGKLRNLNNF